MPPSDQETASKSRSVPDTGNEQNEKSPLFDLDLAVDKIDDLLREEGVQSKYGLKPLSSGERAELRRNPERPFTPTLWKVLFAIEHDEAPRWWLYQENLDEDEHEHEWGRRWAVLLMAMTTCRGQHDDDIRLGTALADAGWAEMRFVRLMETTGQELETYIRHMAQYLASTGEALDWTDVAKLLFFQDGDTAQNIRVGISRSYYGRKQMLKQESDQD